MKSLSLDRDAVPGPHGETLRAADCTIFARRRFVSRRDFGARVACFAHCRFPMRPKTISPPTLARMLRRGAAEMMADSSSIAKGPGTKVLALVTDADLRNRMRALRATIRTKRRREIIDVGCARRCVARCDRITDC